MLVANPAGGTFVEENFKTFQQGLEWEWQAEVVSVETSREREKTALATAQRVNEVESRGSEAGARKPAIIIPYGGDGTIHHVVNGAREHGLTNIIVPANEAGTKRNTARALSPKAKMIDVLLHGVPVSIPLVRTSWETETGEQRELLSVDECAFGASVTALERVVERKDMNRERSLVAREWDEVMTTVNAVANHPTFTARFDDGRVIELASLIFGHCHLIAGKGKVPITNADPNLWILATGKQGKVATFVSLLRLAGGMLPGELTSIAPTSFMIETQDDSPVPIEGDGEYEIDGERLLAASKTRVTVGVSGDHRFMTLATNPKLISRAEQLFHVATLLS